MVRYCIVTYHHLERKSWWLQRKVILIYVRRRASDLLESGSIKTNTGIWMYFYAPLLRTDGMKLKAQSH